MKVISLGLGVQSSTLYLMSSMGEIQRTDCAIFADPGAEHPKTYEYLKWLLKWQNNNNGIPIHVVKKSLYDDLLKQKKDITLRVASIPAFTNNSGMLLRQCTNEYKVEPVIKKIREVHKLKKYKWMKPTEIWIGITTDEAHRMKESPKYNITNKYPLIDLMMNRSDCKKWLEKNDFPVPQKSSCIFCPYHSDWTWREHKKNEKVWKQIQIIDDSIRYKHKLIEKSFLHKSCNPIDSAYLQEDQEDLFGNECEGYCGL